MVPSRSSDRTRWIDQSLTTALFSVVTVTGLTRFPRYTFREGAQAPACCRHVFKKVRFQMIANSERNWLRWYKGPFPLIGTASQAAFFPVILILSLAPTLHLLKRMRRRCTAITGLVLTSVLNMLPQYALLPGGS
jgi:hypothetical protein